MIELPGWKLWLSYLWPISFETRQSEHSGRLTVSLHRGHWRLETEHAIYSSGRHYPPFADSIRFAGFPPESAKVLLLGLGTGSAISILESSGRKYHVTAIDIDPVIIDLARKYLAIPPGWTIDYQCADAADWITEANSSFDLVFADLFIHETTPEYAKGRIFLEGLKKVIAPHGWLLFSKLHNSTVSIKENEGFEDLFKSVFPNNSTLDTDGNRIFCWRNEI